MSWDVLIEAIEEYLEKEEMKEVVQIVAQHPEWQQTEPRLKQLIQKIKVVADAA